LTAIRALSPDVIFVPGYYGQVGVIAKQAKELGITAPLLGGDGWDSPRLWELGGAALDGAYMVNHYSVDDPSPAVQKFVADYKKRYGGTVPDAIAALGYDAMNVLADAIKRAGTTESAKLRDAIAQTKAFSGVTGSISINASRDAVKPAVVFELRDKKLVYKETIQPSGGAASATPAAAGATPAGAAPPAANWNAAANTNANANSTANTNAAP
jgi:branched-chain amino acid transport system substrate-binding protein